MDADALRPERPVVVAAFVVVFVGALATFSLTAAGYYSTHTTDRLSATVTGFEVTDDEPRLVAELVVDNGLTRPVTVGAGELRVAADGEVLTRNAGGFVGERVPAGERTTLRVELYLRDDHVDRAVAAARDGDLVVEGLYRATIEREEIDFGVDTAEGASADG